MLMSYSAINDISTDEIESIEEGIDVLDPATPVTPLVRTQGSCIVSWG